MLPPLWSVAKLLWAKRESIVAYITEVPQSFYKAVLFLLTGIPKPPHINMPNDNRRELLPLGNDGRELIPQPEVRNNTFLILVVLCVLLNLLDCAWIVTCKLATQP